MYLQARSAAQPKLSLANHLPGSTSSTSSLGPKLLASVGYIAALRHGAHPHAECRTLRSVHKTSRATSCTRPRPRPHRVLCLNTMHAPTAMPCHASWGSRCMRSRCMRRPPRQLGAAAPCCQFRKCCQLLTRPWCRRHPCSRPTCCSHLAGRS